MVLPRSPVLRSLFSAQSRRLVAPRSPAVRAWQRNAQRGYSTGQEKAASDEMWWLIGSVAFTVPAAYYLYSTGPAGRPAVSHGSHDDHPVEKVKKLVGKSTDDEPKPEPEAEEPKVEESKAEEPKVEEPKAEKPKTEEPKAEEPKAEESKSEEPKAEKPKVIEETRTPAGAEKPKEEKTKEAEKPAEEEKAAGAEDKTPNPRASSKEPPTKKSN